MIQAGAAFATNLVLVRLISPEGFGRFAVAIAEIGLVVSILSLRLGVLIVRASEQEMSPEMRRLFFNASVQEPVFLVFVAAGALAVTHMLSAWSAVLLVSLVLTVIFANLKAFYERGRPYERLAVFETIVHLAGNGICLVAAWKIGEHALYVRELANVVFSLVGLMWIGGLTTEKLRWVRWHEWRRLAFDIRGVWADQMLEGVFARLTTVFAAFAGGERGAGLFAQANRLAMTPHQFLAPLVTRFSLNVFSRTEDRAERERAFRKGLAMTLCVSSVAAAAAFFLARPIVPFVFGVKWAGSAEVLRALSLGIALISTTEVIKAYLVVLRMNRALVIGRVLQIGALIGVGWVAYRFGAEGGIATGLGSSAGYVLLFLLFLAAARAADRKREKR